ncbi:MAG: sulfatase-like hydrolase/transferase [Bacteroidales bacterium]|nr:sulfatase-like hydrolase/transferase [Bacteroidales bacterium]
MMRLLIVLFLTGTLTPVLLAAGKPNVVLIVIDDMGQRDCGAYGSTFYRTPHIDRLANQGMRFTDGYAACPVCSPTRASLLTGQYPARLNLTDWLPGRGNRPDQMLNRPIITQQLPLEAVTLAEVLQKAGYFTAHIGKWHLGGEGFLPQNQGFAVNIAGDHTGSPRSYFAPYSNKRGTIPGFANAPAGEYLTDRLAAEAVQLIADHKDQPFFLYLSHYAVHTPLQAKADKLAHYPGQATGGRQSHPVYAAMIESMDDAVGTVLQALDTHKLTDNTIVIFISDNGGLATREGGPTGATFNGPLREGKGHLYEGGTRVPFLVRYPGHVKPGSTCTTPVCSIDLFPTLLELCGAPSDAKPDGVSVVPLLKGKTIAPRPLFWHYPHYSNQLGKPGSSIREGDYKLIAFFEDGRRELFDVRHNIAETKNLIVEKPELAKELSRKLTAWRESVGAKMMTPNPDYVPNPQGKNGRITLPARTAKVQGIQLRYEPLPYKDTLGFWTRKEDTARFEFTVTQPGRFTVEVLQGCGKGSGGAEVAIVVGNETLRFTVKDTGGFQAFETREIGTITIEKPGRHTLTVAPQSKPGIAVMDLREIVLKPVRK